MERCTLDNIRVVVEANAYVNPDGSPQPLHDNDIDISDRMPYWCLACDQDFDTWEEVKDHMTAAEQEWRKAQKRLEELRTELKTERISTAELVELQSLAQYIAPGDVELLEAAGVPENTN